MSIGLRSDIFVISLELKLNFNDTMVRKKITDFLQHINDYSEKIYFTFKKLLIFFRLAQLVHSCSVTFSGDGIV